MKIAFVTGATGLLGNNLVRLLHDRGVRVKALVRSRAKAQAQFEGLDIEIIEGDMADVAGFAYALQGCNLLFHTAAHFRDSYKGGNHWEMLYRINVLGTEQLLAEAYRAGIRQMVHTSSFAVLKGQPGQIVNETSDRLEGDADDYCRSKIMSEKVVKAFMSEYPDLKVAFVLPGWMFGPGDIGPTSSGQMILDTAKQKLPGILPGHFAVVDVRDVAQAHYDAALRGRSGERYLVVGKSIPIEDLLALIGRTANVPIPNRKLPILVAHTIALLNEAYARLTGKPVLLSLASFQLLVKGQAKILVDHSKSERELGLTFRPLEETIADTVSWYRAHGFLPASD